MRREIAPLKAHAAYWTNTAATIRATWVPVLKAGAEDASVEDAEQRKEEAAVQAAFIRRELGQIRTSKISAHQARASPCSPPTSASQMTADTSSQVLIAVGDTPRARAGDAERVHSHISLFGRRRRWIRS